jgi:hypothetical protein
MYILSQHSCLFVGRHRHKESLTSRLRLKNASNAVYKDESDMHYLGDVSARLLDRDQGRDRRILDSFFSLPYWRHVWIIQEVTVAATVTIICGHQCISWDMLAIADALHSESESRPWSHVKQLILFRDDYKQGARPSLLDAMDQTDDSPSTDPRDKLFALLGLCHDGEQLVPYPNYKQSVDEILRDFTRAVISAYNDLDYLCLPRIGYLETDKPFSWTG